MHEKLIHKRGCADQSIEDLRRVPIIIIIAVFGERVCVT
jgi:hypothetical protein